MHRLRRRYGHATRKRARGGIAHIIGAEIVHYGDTGQVQAKVRWQSSNGAEGTTEGEPDNLHMQALLDRAVRSGVRIKHSSAGRVYGPGGDWVVPPKNHVPERFR